MLAAARRWVHPAGCWPPLLRGGASGARRCLGGRSGHDGAFTGPAFARQPLSAKTRRALAAMGLERMTDIQAKTLGPALDGLDVLGRARTGTGKTVAFLVPALERTAAKGRGGAKARRQGIDILAISPTRELAMQISDQGEALLQFHERRRAQVMFGGTKKAKDVRALERGAPSLLVATPGRLLDHLQTTRLRDGTPFRELLGRVRVLVLDEADQLLEMGFRKDIEQILSHLPAERQTLLFSATIPKPLEEIMARSMRRGFVTVNCVESDDHATHSAEQVPQSSLLLPSDERAISGVIEVVEAAIHEAATDHKIIAFFPTAQMTAFYAKLFNAAGSRSAFEIHSRKSQAQRTRCSDQFRASRSGVMFSSDVSARGVDYPDVTHVLQFGLPSSPEQYIHRCVTD